MSGSRASCGYIYIYTNIPKEAEEPQAAPEVRLPLAALQPSLFNVSNKSSTDSGPTVQLGVEPSLSTELGQDAEVTTSSEYKSDCGTEHRIQYQVRADLDPLDRG